jgi:ABC-type Fe2+-enterobactin transport system substrate-binding protein
MRDPQDTKYAWDEENFKIIESAISTTSESELVDTRKFLRQTQELCHEYLDAKITAERKRDEAKRLLDKKSKYLAQAITQRDHAETELRKLIDFSKSVLVERDKWRKCAEKLAEIIGAPDEMESRLWKTDDEINEAWSVFEKLKEDAK